MSDDETETAKAFATLYADRPDVLAKLFVQAGACATASHNLAMQLSEAVRLQGVEIERLRAMLTAAGVEVPAA